MKLGGIVLLYVMFAIWTATNRIANVIVIMIAACIGNWLISIWGEFTKNDKLYLFGKKYSKLMVKLIIIAIIAMLTCGPLVRWIFL